MDIRRIVLVLDPSQRDPAALLSAAHLAAQLDAQLQALMVRDASLERLAALPTAAEIVVHSAQWRRLEPQMLEADSARFLQRVNRELEHSTRELRLAWSVGVTSTEQLLQLQSPDLLVVQRRTGHAPVGHDELGLLVAKITAEGRQSVLVFEEAFRLELPPAALIGGEGRALDIALRFAQTSGRLRLLVDAASAQDYESLRAHTLAQCTQRHIAVETQWLRAPGSDVLAHTLHGSAVGLLVLDASLQLLRHEPLVRILKSLRRPLMLVR